MSTAVVIPSRELEHRVLELRRSGCSTAAIASELQITPKRVETIVRRVYARYAAIDETYVDVERKTVLGRIDEMINALYDQAIGKEPRIVKLASTGEEIAVKSPSIEALKLIKDLDKSRRELLGLDLTQKKEQGSGAVTVNVVYGTQATTKNLPPTNPAAPAVEVSYSEVKCLPEGKPQE